MEFFQSIDSYTDERPCAVTVGKFDGVHLGHRLLAEHLLAQKENGLVTVVVTFDMQPANRVRNAEILNIITPEERRRTIAGDGVDVLIEQEFDEEFMKLSPEAFIRLLVDKLHMKYMVSGSDFQFGYMGKGNVSMLKDLSIMYHFVLEVIEKKKSNKRDISSTFIREEIIAGRIKNANALLGYSYYIIGDIIHGNQIGSSILSFPTINIRPPENKLLPPNGVYLVGVTIDGRRFCGIANVGVRPTIQESKKRVGVETYILDFDGNVYEKEARIDFLDMVRAEIKFDSLDDLKTQIAKDVDTAKEYFNSSAN